MDIPSLRFLIFAAIAAILYNLSAARGWRQLVFLAANLLFIASFVHAPIELLPYAGFLAIGYAAIMLVRRGVATAVYAVAIGLTILLFCWLKRYSFLPQTSFIGFPYLLVGLSYVFFRVLHLVIDARHPEDCRPLRLVEYLNFTLNFTSITSGPIQRYEDYYRMTAEAPLPLDGKAIALAIERIVTGLFKLFVMGTIVSIVQQRLIYHLDPDSPLVDRVATGVALAALYPIFLYFNFAGYTDFVIGIARFFRLDLPENFDRPFTATSFIDYWNRWHMSLSNWLRTYVYNPLLTSMMRRIKSPAVLPYAGAAALFVTFFLIGAWHGRTSKFLFFGLLNGVGVAINQAYRIILTKRMGRRAFNEMSARWDYRYAARGVTFAWVSFTLLWFWSDWAQLGDFTAKIGTCGVLICWVALPVIAAVVIDLMMRAETLAFIPQLPRGPMITSRYVRACSMSMMLFCILIVQGVMSAGPPGVIYKDF